MSNTNKSVHEKMKRKHDSLCDRVYQLLEQKGKTVFKNVFYGDNTKRFGECDILEQHEQRCVYWEIKTNYSEQNYEKARHQLLQYTSYMSKKDNKRNYYGVFYTPQHIVLLSKNDEERYTLVK